MTPEIPERLSSMSEAGRWKENEREWGQRRGGEEERLSFRKRSSDMKLKEERTVLWLITSSCDLPVSSAWSLPVSRRCLFQPVVVAFALHCSIFSLANCCFCVCVFFQPWVWGQQRGSFWLSSGYMGSVQDLKTVSWAILLSELHTHIYTIQQPGLTNIYLQSVQKYFTATLWSLL